MTSQVKIAKLALSHLGDRYDLTSLNDTTPEAEAVKLVFDTARDEVLRNHPWNFAQTFVSPTAIATGTPPANWDYMFTYPDEALKVTRIVNPLGAKAPPIRFKVARNSAGAKVLLCDIEEPEFQYTARIVDPYEFDALFIKAFSYKIAEDVALTLTGEKSVRSDMRVLYNAAIESAKSDDANEGVDEEHDQDADWILARA